MEYKDKDYANQGAPDGFDLDDCPVYQAWLKKCDEDSLKKQMQEQLNDDISDYHKRSA